MIKETLKERLRRAPIAPSYEFHEAVEDALLLLPYKRTRPFYRRTGALAATICAVMVIGAIPFAYRALSPARPATPTTFAQPDPTVSGGSGVLIPAGATARLVGASDEPVGHSDSAPSTSYMETGDRLRSMTLVAPSREADFEKEKTFFREQFPGMRIGGFEMAVDDRMNLALMGVLWDEEKSRLKIGAMLYGPDLFSDLVNDREMLNGLWLKDVYINGERLEATNEEDAIRNELSSFTSSSTGYIYSVPMEPAMVKDEFCLMQINFEHETLSFEHAFDIKVNLIAKEIRLPSDPNWENIPVWPETMPDDTLGDKAFPMPQVNINVADGSVTLMPQPSIDTEAVVPMPTAPINEPRYTPVPTPVPAPTAESPSLEDPGE